MKSNINLVELIGETVKLKKVGREWQGLCPFHADSNPSLKVDEVKGLWNCFSCKIGGGAPDWVMRRDKVDLSEAMRRLEIHHSSESPPTEKKIVATYDYTDAAGKLLYQVVRYFPKSFSQRQPDGKGGNHDNLKGVETVLYNLPALAAADTVWLCEGEKDANRLNAEGLVATTSPGGASNWKPQYAQSLAGKRVNVIPDNDAEGERYANMALTSLKNVAKETRICRLPGLPPKGDVSDWLDAGHTVADLEKFCLKPDTEPKLEIRGGIYEFRWASFIATVSRVHEDRHGQASGEIKVCTVLIGSDPVLVQTKLNLLSTRSQSDLVKRLEEKAPSQNWEYVVEQICYGVLEALRQGEPAVELWTHEEVLPPQYLLSPFVAENQPNFIYGPGGSAKSYLALLIGMALQLGWHDNPFHWDMQRQSYPLLYLDWETTRNEIAWRQKCLKCGLELKPDMYLNYRRCTAPLADDIEAIASIVTSTGSKVIIVDSLAAACGGELNEAQTALRFFAALRHLNITSILVAHTPKSGEDQAKQIYGSVFFANYGRNNWEVKKTQEVDEDEFVVGLFHRKTNLSKLHKPIGLRFEFAEGRTKVSMTDLQQTELSAEEPLQKRLESFLLAEGTSSVKDLAEGIGASAASVRMCLNRFRSKPFIKAGKDWTVKAREYIK